MAAEIPLLAKVDVGNDEIVHKDDAPTFRDKNTLPYKGLLSNYRKLGKEGYVTTNGNEVDFDKADDKNILYTVSENLYYRVTDTIKGREDYTAYPVNKTITSEDLYIPRSIIVNGKSIALNYSNTIESEIIKYPVQGELVDEAIIEDENYFIIKSSSIFYIVHNDEYEPLQCNDAYFCRNVPVIALVNGNNTALYNVDNLSELLLSLEYPTNNGWYDGNKAVLGYEKDDHYLCNSYYYDGSSWTSFSYFGCVGFDGKIYGEPIPVAGINGIDITYNTPERLSNGVLRWTLDAAATSSIKKAENTSISSTDKSACNNNSMTGTAERYEIIFSIDPINGTVDYIENVIGVSSLLKEAVTDTFSRILIGNNNSPGVFDGNLGKDEYANVFPCKYFFSNIVTRRGIDYDYGRGWYKAKYQKLWFGKAKVENSKYPVLLEEPYHYKYYYDDDTSGDIIMDALGAAVREYSLSGNSFKLGIDDEVANETRFWYDSTNDIYLRHHIITQDEIDANAWNDFIHTTNFDVSALPFYRKENEWTLHYYGDVLVGISKEGTAIGPFSTEYSGIIYTNENSVLVDEFNYKLSDSTPVLTKIADYLFQINIVGANNILIENKSSDSTYEIIRGSVPYINEMIPSDNIRSLKLLLAEDGSAYNDLWYEAGGVNVNLDDKIPSSSGLLPAVEVDMYIDTDNLDVFNNSVIHDGNPILRPLLDSLVSSDELAVYYTHTQLTTDILYRYSVIDGATSKNSKFEGNSWWSTSDIIILPIGVGSKFSNVNYISSTLTLPDTYNARLYVQNNTAYIIYNAATQIYHSTATFTIYASSYYYDGQAIYYSGSINSTTANDLVCYAIGMKFLANSGTEAYFYSDYDKAIYTFSGSNTMTRSTPLSMFGEPISAVFSSYNQSLYLLNSDGDVLVLTGESSALFNDTGATSLESIVGGCAFIGNDNWSIYSPKDGEIIPINVTTDWIGDSSQLYQFSYGDIVLYDDEPKDVITVKLFLYTMNSDDKGNVISTVQSEDIQITKSEWKAKTYRLRINPPDIIGNAFKIGIQSDYDIHIMSMIIESKKTAAYNNTAKGWR